MSFDRTRHKLDALLDHLGLLAVPDEDYVMKIVSFEKPESQPAPDCVVKVEGATAEGGLVSFLLHLRAGGPSAGFDIANWPITVQHIKVSVVSVDGSPNAQTT